MQDWKDDHLPVPHRPWSTLLLVLHSLGVVAGVAAVGAGAVIAVASLTVRPDPDAGIYEPWGIVIGVLLAAVGAVVLVPAAVLTVLTVRGRRAAEQGRPGLLRAAAITTVALAGVGAAGTLVSGDPFTVLLGVVLCGSGVLAGILVLRATSRAGVVPQPLR